MMTIQSDKRGVALLVAIVAALVVSLTAVAALNLTFKRFELSTFRSDHLVANFAAEAGLQYAFARLDRDPAFKSNVIAKAPNFYGVTCHNSTPGADLNDNRLHSGNKHVTVRVKYRGVGAVPQFEVRGSADFGTGS